jgi:exopolyphosphatase/guanosine-5'-triphosphate,3'-diphosphate pyrophosphatase
VLETSNSTFAQPPVYAAIDLGTNNCRLLIAQPNRKNGTGMQVIDRFSRIVRLGEGLGKAGCLSDAAIKRTTEALKVCAQKIKSSGVYQTSAIATEACRQASNDKYFFHHVEQETGIRFKTITSKEEGELTLAGCMPLLTKELPHVLMFDIGGGSTELIWLEKKTSKDPNVIDILSLPFGVVSLAEEFGPNPLSSDDIEKLINRIDTALNPFEDNHDIVSKITSGNVQVLGTSSTVTTMGSIYLNQSSYDRAQVDGLSIRYESIYAICKKLISLDIKALKNHPCIGPSRADLMVMGCVILTTICRRWPAKCLTAADRGIREGLLLGMMSSNQAIY